MQSARNLLSDYTNRVNSALSGEVGACVIMSLIQNGFQKERKDHDSM